MSVEIQYGKGIYSLLETLNVIEAIQNNIDATESYARAFQDLHYGFIYESGGIYRVSLEQNFKLNGSLCADPEMVFDIDIKGKEAVGISLKMEMSPMCVYAYNENNEIDYNIFNDVNAFAFDFWLPNLIRQGHKLKG